MGSGKERHKSVFKQIKAGEAQVRNLYAGFAQGE